MIPMLFIRHGATKGNLERRYIGCTDEPLCAEGVAQLEKLRPSLWKPERLFVSPMLRTRQTAELLFPGLPQETVEGFRETDFGVFEGKNAGELSGNPAYRAWVDSMCLDPIPQGESPAAFKARCRAAFLDLLPAIPEETPAAFVVHGGVIMAILEAYARPQRDFYDYHRGNGACLQCRYERGWLHVRDRA